MRLPGFEPEFRAWEAPVIATKPQSHIKKIVISDIASDIIDFVVVRKTLHMWFLEATGM